MTILCVKFQGSPSEKKIENNLSFFFSLREDMFLGEIDILGTGNIHDVESGFISQLDDSSNTIHEKTWWKSPSSIHIKETNMFRVPGLY